MVYGAFLLVALLGGDAKAQVAPIGEYLLSDTTNTYVGIGQVDSLWVSALEGADGGLQRPFTGVLVSVQQPIKGLRYGQQVKFWSYAVAFSARDGIRAVGMDPNGDKLYIATADREDHPWFRLGDTVLFVARRHTKPTRPELSGYMKIAVVRFLGVPVGQPSYLEQLPLRQSISYEDSDVFSAYAEDPLIGKENLYERIGRRFEEDGASLANVMQEIQLYYIGRELK